MFKKITQWACLLAALLFALPARAVVIDNYAWQFPIVTGISGATDLQTTLQEEIQAVLNAGDLAPLYISRADQVSNGYTLYNEPGRIITTLAWAYPYLTTAQQTAVKTYVQNELNSSTFSPWSTFPAPHGSGAARELHQKEKWWYERTSFGNRPSVQTIYGLWLYGYRTGDWTSVQNKWTNIKSMYTARSGQGNLYGTMCAHIAMARLAYQFSDSATQTTALNNLQTQLNAGVTFSTIETNTQTAYNNPNMYLSTQDGSIYRGFMFLNLSPEMGRYLLDNVNSSTTTRNNLGKSTFPHWYVGDISYFQRDTTGDEGTGLLPETRGMIFPVERWVVGANSTTLRKEIRGGAVGIGDCYWLEALVQTIEAHGTYAWTDIRSGSAPNAPTNLTATAVSSSQINLSWTDNSTNETQFKVERKLGVGGTYAQINTTGANVTTYNDTGLAASTNYYYRVRANNASGDSAYSNEANATTQAGGSPPNAPSGLTATAVSSSQINLGWTDNSSNETQFKIERKTGVGGTYAQIGTTGANVTTYNNTGLAASTNYYYRVRANNASGDSAYSNEANATTQAGGGGGNLLTDGDFQSATGFTGNTNYTAGTTADGVWYCNSAWTKTANAGPNGAGDTAATLTNNFSDLRLMQGIAAPASGTQMTLGFQYVRPSGFASTVTVYGMTNGQVANVFAGGSIQGTQLFQYTLGTSASYATVSNQTFTLGATYTHLLLMVSVGGDAGDKMDNITLSGGAGSPPNAPSSLTATAVSSSQINLAWTDNASNETGFKVERKLGAGGTYGQIATPAANATSYNDTGLTASTTYYYRVRANNGAGDSAYSNEANATTQAGGAAVGLAFNGTSSTTSAADSASLDIAGTAITMEAWVNLGGPNAFNLMDAVGRQVISSGNGFTRWHGISGYANGQQWKFGLVIGPTYFTAQNGTTLSNGQWYHMAGTYDGSNVRFFINGTVVATTAATGNVTVNDNAWHVGSTGSAEWFQGSIDEVRISNNARYTANFTPPTAAFSNDANTKALWHMNENTGTTSADASGNSNTLTLTSTTWTTGKF